jgi:hypothetical protein
MLMGGHLHQHLEVFVVGAEQERHPGHALGADQADLRAIAVFHGSQPKNVTCLGEMDAADRLLWRVQGLVELKLDPFEPGSQPGKVRRCQGGEQAVARRRGRLIGEGHDGLLRPMSAGALTSLCHPRRVAAADDG